MKTVIVENIGDGFFKQTRLTINQLQGVLELYENTKPMSLEESVELEKEIMRLEELINYWKLVLKDNNQPWEVQERDHYWSSLEDK